MSEDAVSRNAIIQKLNTMDRYVSEELILCDTDKKFPKNEVFIVDDVYEEIVENLPSAQPEIIYCKDCVKHNKGHGYYLDGTVIGIKDCCPLVEIRGMAQGHEFDYQYCAYAERRTDG